MWTKIKIASSSAWAYTVREGLSWPKSTKYRTYLTFFWDAQSARYLERSLLCFPFQRVICCCCWLKLMDFASSKVVWKWAVSTQCTDDEVGSLQLCYIIHLSLHLMQQTSPTRECIILISKRILSWQSTIHPTLKFAKYSFHTFLWRLYLSQNISFLPLIGFFISYFHGKQFIS